MTDDAVLLACPACLMEGRGVKRVTTQRGVCRLCNRVAQRVERGVARAMRARHPEEWDELRTVELVRQWSGLDVDEEDMGW